MKNLTLIIFVLLFAQITTFSQPCLPEGITFSTQEQIDNFQTIHPNCTEIEGGVEIFGDDITNLDGLNVLNSIGGYLYIRYNSDLASLSGLSNLVSVDGDIEIISND
ncbi:MAG: hypothetical protein K8R74_11240 [Bacteroidales bacterium]|nr:hypothetical protein [Bacteroidales bacterium]